MTVRSIEPGESLGARRGEVVVCIPVYGAHEQFAACLDSVLAHTPADVRILVCDDASPDARSGQHVLELDVGERLVYARGAERVGFPANVNRAFAASAPADVVVLNSDCVVAAGWLEAMREAAYSDSRVATVTPLTNHGTIVSVPERGMPTATLPPGWTIDEAAAAVRGRALRIRPRLPSAIGHCMYVRRTALELVGDFDLAFSPGYGEEVDFSQRCRQQGLAHVLADDVFVFHHGGGSFGSGERPNPTKLAHERVIAARYPYYHEAVRAVERDASGPLARALSVARRALVGLDIVIDARVLSGPMTGTQVHVLEVLAALARTQAARVRALVPAQLSPEKARLLAEIPSVEQVPLGPDGVVSMPRADVYHRPFQISTHADLVVAAHLGERMILTQQDMIAYHNPAYFSSFGAWDAYRGLTRKALAVADRVVFISAHARQDALTEQLVEPERASIVPNGVDHTLALGSKPVAVAPAAAASLPADSEVIVCLGTDFRHKNRVFALRLVDELQRRHGWSGRLVLAGPHVREGGSVREERLFLERHPGVAAATIDVRAVSEEEKVWLLERSALMLYPTVHEGFGLVPFEAADHGLPCMWAPGTSLSEILPPSAATILPWDAAATADRAIALMRDAAEREANIAGVHQAAAGLSWDAAAARLIDVYNEACDEAPTPASAFERRHGQMKDGISDDGMRLVGPDGALPREVERPLLALAMRPQIRTPVFGAIKLGYRASYRLRRRGRP